MNLQNFGEQLRNSLRQKRMDEYESRITAMVKAHEDGLANEEKLLNDYLEQIDKDFGFTGTAPVASPPGIPAE